MWLSGKLSAYNVGDLGSITGLGSSTREGDGYSLQYSWASPCGSAGKESTCNVGDLGGIPGLGRSPGEGKGYPLQYSGLESSMDCIIHGVAKSRTPLNDFDFPTCLGPRQPGPSLPPPLPGSDALATSCTSSQHTLLACCPRGVLSWARSLLKPLLRFPVLTSCSPQPSLDAQRPPKPIRSPSHSSSHLLRCP